jgi:hypothetical protein
MGSLTSITTGDEHVSCGRHCSWSIQMRNTNNELTIRKRRQNCGKEDANDIKISLAMTISRSLALNCHKLRSMRSISVNPSQKFMHSAYDFDIPPRYLVFIL